ncbi:MAG: adenylyltransferase/cytidyltransferase family protein [Pseudomonadota bacterium]
MKNFLLEASPQGRGLETAVPVVTSAGRHELPPSPTAGFENLKADPKWIDFRHADAARLPRPLVLTNGVFDLLHCGHVNYLKQARDLGACLLVGVNSDASVRRLGKGPERPIHTAADRAYVLAALGCVTHVAIFEETTPWELIHWCRPELYVKGGDYDVRNLKEAQWLQAWGGRALTIPIQFAQSTTQVVGRLREAPLSAATTALSS